MAKNIEELGGGGDVGTVAEGQTMYYVVQPNMKVSVPDAGANVLVEYSLGDATGVHEDTTTWTTWPAKGHANTAYTWTSVVTRYLTYFRVTSTSGAATVTVTTPTREEMGSVFALEGVDRSVDITALTADTMTVDAGTFGAAAGSLIGFHGATPVDQADFVADPSGGATQDAEARTAIGAILDVLIEKGLMAAS